MGKSKQIRPAIPDLITEKTVFFKKRDDGYYNKVTKTILKEKHTFKQTSCVTSVSEEIYEQTTGSDYDHVFSYEDFDGSKKSLRFKQVSKDST